MMTRLAKWWLERQGFYLVRPGAVEMVLSGYFLAVRKDDGSYTVWPPFPHINLTALNHTVITSEVHTIEGATP